MLGEEEKFGSLSHSSSACDGVQVKAVAPALADVCISENKPSESVPQIQHRCWAPSITSHFSPFGFADSAWCPPEALSESAQPHFSLPEA